MSEYLSLVKPTKPKNKLPAKQLGGVESPATVLLIPVSLDKETKWWSHDGILLGGIEISRIKKVKQIKKARVSRVGYLPRPIPRSWGEKDFHVVLEYEAEDDSAFQFKLYYGCGDPSELRLGETKVMKGKSGSKKRLRFKLKPKYIISNELFRATIEVQRLSPGSVLIYGAWMELGV